ncbi:MAG TPA: DUF4236 domain-containing protein [Cyclobacteriaceae bacterium]|nr:DUF4236 domain-containing protein [Cyclobacteriaceae bacterium]
MPWYFRKSFKLGAFRINLSKSGIGASVGIKGARVSAGPRGTYLNLGTNGLYYRKRLDTPGERSGKRSLPFRIVLVLSFFATVGAIVFLGRPVSPQRVFVTKFEVTKNAVRIREMPSLHAKIIATCNTGDTFNYLREDTVTHWVQIELPGKRTGYIKSELGIVKRAARVNK